MSKPLTEEVAREYGYPEDSFEKWLGKYFDSLKVEERANQIQPIKQFKSKVGMPLLTEEIKKYVSEIKRGKYSTHLTLNPNYIYIIKFAIPYGQKKIPYYIPTKKPFNFRNSDLYPNSYKIEGVYDKGAEKRNYSYTNEGFDFTQYEIIGILKFPSQIEFMNWQGNPLEVKNNG